MKVSISDDEFKIYEANVFARYLRKSQYPKDINSGKPIMEFVWLADKCRDLGIEVISNKKIVDCLKTRVPVLKFGKTDVYDDMNLLSQYGNNAEWNFSNLEKILYWTQ